MIDVLLVIVVPALVGIVHWHLRWSIVCSMLMGSQAFAKGYLQKLAHDRHLIRAIAIAPMSFFVGTLPYLMVSTILFWISLTLTHGRLKL